MTITRAQLRTAVRQRAEDESASPLWSDQRLDAALSDALARYAARVPAARTITPTVAAGATTVDLAATLPVVRGDRLTAVRDGAGVAAPRGHPTVPDGPDPAPWSGPVALSWSDWGAELRLSRPVTDAEAGTWTIDYLASRALIADDVTPQPIDAGDELIVIAYAVSNLLLSRGTADAKRGLTSANTVATLARLWETTAKDLLAARDRRGRGGWFAP